MTHLVGLLFVVLCVAGVAAALAWNFWPGFRQDMKGKTTLLEGALGLIVTCYGQFAGGIQDAQAAGYIPPQLAPYVVPALFIWVFLKRFGTSTPVGQKY
jgi:drug/metabolite transporter (DMT)-like permease